MRSGPNHRWRQDMMQRRLILALAAAGFSLIATAAAQAATPNDASERLALYQQVLGSQSDKIDVFQVDVVWPGILGSHFLDLKPYTKGVEKTHFPSMVANGSVQGKLVAMPWFIDAG